MFFLFLFIIIIIINIIIIFGKIIVEIDNLKISSKRNQNINDSFKIIIKLKIFNKITILKSVYNKKKINKISKKIKKSNKMKNINMQKLVNQLKEKDKLNIKVFNTFFKDMFEIKNIDIKIKIGTENAAITAILTGIISTVISIVLRYKIKENRFQKFKIIPVYTNKNRININISGIFGIKLIHIINIIYIFIKEKGEDKYERASNRKSYDYSYG